MSEFQRILIIDDESSIRSTLKLVLKDNYSLAEAATGLDGLEKATSFHPHLIVLDLGLPDLNGFEVLKKLRHWTTIPIIILTATDDEITKVKLLDAGADDYLTKPFGPSELLARVRVSLRHYNYLEATPLFESGHLQVDLNLKKVFINKQQVKLTSTEFEVLAHLVREQGKVVPQMQILKAVWNTTHEDQSHYLRIYINQLRKKLEENPSRPTHIITEPGVGYRLI